MTFFWQLRNQSVKIIKEKKSIKNKHVDVTSYTRYKQHFMPLKRNFVNDFFFRVISYDLNLNRMETYPRIRGITNLEFLAI